MDDVEPAPPPSGTHSQQTLSVTLRNSRTLLRVASSGMVCGNESDQQTQHRQRTYKYFDLLPFEVEPKAARDDALHGILKELYIALEAGDYQPGVIHCTRELNAWLGLKFEMPRQMRARLAQLYYHLALAPGMEAITADRFARMMITLTKRKHYLACGDDLILDWRPLWDAVKGVVFPGEGAPHQMTRKRSQRQIWRLCWHCPQFFDPKDRLSMLEEIVPFFTCSEISNAFIVFGALNAMFPTTASRPTEPLSQPADFLPTIFHLWSLMGRSKTADANLIDLLSRLAKDHLQCLWVPFSEHGIFTKEQSDLLFTTMLRFTDIPVGQANSPYTENMDYAAGLGLLLERDKKKISLAYLCARLIVSSLSPACLQTDDSILANLEGFIQSIDTFFHPSNHGTWSLFLAQLILSLADSFVSRWNMERSGEADTPPERQINAQLKRRFVLALRDVTFMGLFGKGSKVTSLYYSALQVLAYLEPQLILPGALQRFYPSLQGLVEVHRTTSSLCSLQLLAHIIGASKGFRCHLTSLLGLALPGIDANDLTKTQQSLYFIQTVAYSIPFVPLTDGGSEIHDTTLAVEWVQAEMERMELEGTEVKIDYDAELTDEQERQILQSSTAGFEEFVLALLSRVFTLLQNLPDANSVKTSSPEENVINTLPGALAPIFASLSDDIFDLALEKFSIFVATHVVHQARDAIAWICSAMCKANPEKTCKVMIPILIANIHNEIDNNNAASDRSSGHEILPRDRALVWYVSILSMCVVHVGDEALKYAKDLRSIAEYMHEKCKGLATIHISNFSHHLLLNLTHTYPMDMKLYEPAVFERGLDVSVWGLQTNPQELTIQWHRPSQSELEFAVELFESQVHQSSERLQALMGGTPPSVSRKGKHKEWSDEFTRHLSHIRLMISGVCMLFDPEKAAYSGNDSSLSESNDDTGGEVPEVDDDDNDDDNDDDDDDEQDVPDDDELRPRFSYAAGYVLDRTSHMYLKLHEVREKVGRLLLEIHQFLIKNHEDDVACFTSLYSVYRTWITDVGIERSARPFERLSRLYKGDIASFKIKGLRKEYPRPLLVRRADTYRLQRVKHNASARRRSKLDSELLLNLAESCTSPYTDVRKTAQGALDSSVKILEGGRVLVVPVVLERLSQALRDKNHDRIKGALFTIFNTSLFKTATKNWKFASRFVLLFIETAKVDKPSIQQLGVRLLYSVLDFGRAVEDIAILDPNVIKTIEPDKDCSERINSRKAFLQKRKTRIDDKQAKLGLQLIEQAKTSHWKISSRSSIFATNLCLRFNSLVPPSFVELVVAGTIDPHPHLRSNYMDALTNVFNLVDKRAAYNHDYRNYILEKAQDLNKLVIDVPRGTANWTETFLDSFGDLDKPPEYFVDSDHPGWLAWGKQFTAYDANPKRYEGYDDNEMSVLKQIGRMLTKEWLKTLFEYLKQEPRDPATDRVRSIHVLLLMNVFDMVNYGIAAVTFDEVKELTLEVYGDGSDKNQHRVMSEILGAFLAGSADDPAEYRDRAYQFAAPFMLKVFAESLTPENIVYWITCLHLVVTAKDPRRTKEIVRPLTSFRLDMNSNAAFKESAQIQLLELIVNGSGWHFRLEKPILDDFLAHINHPYKSVREAIGKAIATIYRIRYHESYPSVAELLQANKASSPVGIRPYQPTEEFSSTMKNVFDRLETWRHERQPGQQDQSDYTSGCKTVLSWMNVTLGSNDGAMLVEFFPTMIEQLLHMMDVKEDPELMRLAYHVYRHMPNVSLRPGEAISFIEALVRIGKTATSWHQRLRALINMQVIYFRRLFVTGEETRKLLFEAVGDMLADPQLEVRNAAASTLAGMIRCSPHNIREPAIFKLKARFEEELRLNPMPKIRKGSDTPVDKQKRVIKRHAAVLGLGALVEAFPYATPPPVWMPEVLAHLATKAAGDPGVVGKATKTILSEFKKTRQDSWLVDQKYFTREQLDDLEGVLWKSYFA